MLLAAPTGWRKQEPFGADAALQGARRRPTEREAAVAIPFHQEVAVVDQDVGDHRPGLDVVMVSHGRAELDEDLSGRACPEADPPGTPLVDDVDPGATQAEGQGEIAAREPKAGPRSGAPGFDELVGSREITIQSALGEGARVLEAALRHARLAASADAGLVEAERQHQKERTAPIPAADAPGQHTENPLLHREVSEHRGQRVDLLLQLLDADARREGPGVEAKRIGRDEVIPRPAAREEGRGNQGHAPFAGLSHGGESTEIARRGRAPGS
ncbi:hypothetical protein [Sorangium sp. So ce1000]|uniref:hypothetical protein n=1 Tax=Sorangium sp. So ce1000 TaxID=3133325 RepID=UPI003F61C04C